MLFNGTSGKQADSEAVCEFSFGNGPGGSAVPQEQTVCHCGIVLIMHMRNSSLFPTVKS